MSFTYKLRRDTAANWTSQNPILESGEQGYETDTSKMKIGDGSTTWTSLEYFAKPIESQADSDWTLRQLSDSNSILNELSTNEGTTHTTSSNSFSTGSKTIRMPKGNLTKFEVGQYVRLFPIGSTAVEKKSFLGGDITAINEKLFNDYDELVVNVVDLVFGDGWVNGTPNGSSYSYWRITNIPSVEYDFSGRYSTIIEGKYLNISDQRADGKLVISPQTPTVTHKSSSFCRGGTSPIDYTLTTNTWVDMNFFEGEFIQGSGWAWNGTFGCWIRDDYTPNRNGTLITIGGTIDLGTQTLNAGDEVIIQFINAVNSASGAPVNTGDFIHQFKHIQGNSGECYFSFSTTISGENTYGNSIGVERIRLRMRINTSYSNRTIAMFNPTSDKWSRIDLGIIQGYIS